MGLPMAVKKAVKKAVAKVRKEVKPTTAKSTGMSLVVVESPSKAKTIKKYLGRGFEVVASNGHIKDLPKSKLGVDLKTFKMDLVPLTGKKDKMERITALAKRAHQIYLATDPDREGEAIAFHIAEEIGHKKKVQRVLFNAITKRAVTEGINHPLDLDEKKYDSQKTRRILDRLVGYKISPILWDKVQRGLSAGRVQSVALKVIVQRDEEIKAFVPTPWYSITAKFKKDEIPFEALYAGENPQKKEELTDKALAEKIVQEIQGQNFVVFSLKQRERKQYPTPPFTTSKLQQEAAHKLGFTAKRTMAVAQRLYEGVNTKKFGMVGLITYMRTDSVRTDPEALENLRKFISTQYGKDFVAPEAVIYKKKGTSKVQDAHEAIRPSDLMYSPDEVKNDLEPDEFKLYCLIWNKFIASQMAPAIIDQTSLVLEVKGHYFRASGGQVKFAGFRTVYLEAAEKAKKKKADEKNNNGNDDDDDEVSGILPPLALQEVLHPTEAPSSQEHWTTPPPRYGEAMLVKELEENGIGRPSTYAAIISNIQDRGYVEKIEGRFRPTELGVMVCRMLEQSFPEIMNIEFTAQMEDQLDQIEDGTILWRKVLKDFWGPFEKTLEKAKAEMKDIKKQSIPTGIKCHKCKTGEYQIKWGRNGQFLACSNYPECNSTQDFKRHADDSIEIIPKEYAKEKCPNCGARLVVKKGRYGRFFTCENYPNCKTNLPYTLDVTCPKCKKGKFCEKTSRYGKLFYGCTAYPDCDNAMWIKPVQHECPNCHYPVMGLRENKKGKTLECPQCKHKIPLAEDGSENS